MTLDDKVWQLTGEDQWIFGVMVRGVVRKPVAEIYYDEHQYDPVGDWVWFLHGGPRGRAPSFQRALIAVEDTVVATDYIK